MRILTCNIRGASAPDGENNWPYRNELCADVIRACAADIICFQEMQGDQFDYFHPRLADYDRHAMPDEETEHNPLNAIFYRKDAFTRIAAGGYWLSETPEAARSSSWDSACIRWANWLRLVESESGVEFRVVNTHLDHISQKAREGQARVICLDCSTHPDAYPQILTGDMNCDAGNRAIALFEEAGWRDTYTAVHGPAEPGHTFHQFLGRAYTSDTGKMDWVFTRGNVAATGAHVVRDAKDGRYPSDHFFVTADVAFGK